MVRAASARTDWFRGIQAVKVGRADKVPAEDVGEPGGGGRRGWWTAEERAEAEASAEHLAECLEAVEVEWSAGAED